MDEGRQRGPGQGFSESMDIRRDVGRIFPDGHGLGDDRPGLGASSFGDGLVLGLVTGVVFVGAQAWVNATYENRSVDLVITNGGIGILGHVIMAVIVTVWT